MFRAKKKKNSDLYNYSYSESYRQHDDIAPSSDAYKYFEDTLSNLTISFQKQINVLDLGCGTGRHFSSIKNTSILVGIDTSNDMLSFAKNNPLKFEEISASKIELINSDLLKFNTEYMFDFIYSIGVYGEHAFFDFKVLKKINSLLKNSGILFITLQSGESLPMGKKHFIYKYILNFFPLEFKIYFSKVFLNYPFLYKKDIKKIFSKFDYKIEKFIDFKTNSESWSGSHYHLIVKKNNN